MRGMSPSSTRRPFYDPPADAMLGHGRSPADVQRLALRVARGALHADQRPIVELLQRPRARVGTGAPEPGDDRVQQVLDTGRLRVDIHPRGRDPLLEQRLARTVERGVLGGPQAYGA